jgi:uncharacterized protein (TIGR00369 family)
MSVSKLGLVVPFAELLGVQLLEARDGRSRLEMEIRPEFTNSWHMAHGGVIMTLLDIALAVAARTLDPDCPGAMTVELKVNFISPGHGKLIAEGRAVGGGRSITVSEGEIRDASGALVAKAIGTFKLRRARQAAEGPGDG